MEIELFNGEGVFLLLLFLSDLEHLDALFVALGVVGQLGLEHGDPADDVRVGLVAPVDALQVGDGGQQRQVGDGQRVAGRVPRVLQELVQIVQALLQRVGLDRIARRAVEQDRLLHNNNNNNNNNININNNNINNSTSTELGT